MQYEELANNTTASTTSVCLPDWPALAALTGLLRCLLLPAGVDYEAILRQAEMEGDVIIWDGEFVC